jgi:acyl carrier protein
MNIEDTLRQALLPVFGLNSLEEVPLQASLVNDLGADSLDFVEIIYLIEQHFNVVLKANELIVAGVKVDSDHLFAEGKLTIEGAALLAKQFPDQPARFQPGLTKIQLFQSITVQDLADIIRKRMEAKV